MLLLATIFFICLANIILIRLSLMLVLQPVSCGLPRTNHQSIYLAMSKKLLFLCSSKTFNYRVSNNEYYLRLNALYLRLLFICHNSLLMLYIAYMSKNIFQSQNAVRKFFPVVGASVSFVVFFIALASGINGTVNYFYPREIYKYK